MGGRPVAVTRLISFEFPVEFAEADITELMTDAEFESLKRGDLVAVEIRHHGQLRVYVARIERTYQGSELVLVQLLRVPTTERYGPWQRRRWELWADETGAAYKETLGRSDVLCKVELVDAALTQQSLERLALVGVLVGDMPSRDATLPPRVAM